VAAAIEDDPDHTRCVAFFDATEETLVVPQLVLAEAGYLVGKLAGPVAEVAFVRRLSADQVELPGVNRDDLRRMGELMETYADLRLGIVDAAVMAIAERPDIRTIATIDLRDFSVVRPRHVPHFEIVP
jgi:uncharacterized protein